MLLRVKLLVVDLLLQKKNMFGALLVTSVCLFCFLTDGWVPLTGEGLGFVDVKATVDLGLELS